MHEAQHRQACSERIGFEGLDAFPDCAVRLAVIEDHHRHAIAATGEGRRKKSVLQRLAGRTARVELGGEHRQVREPDEADARPLDLVALRRGAVQSKFGSAQDG
jgi:hypothetical protein